MSLAEQLQKLQIPGQAVIQQISSKRVSLLFDSRTAASLDNEAIQNIGLQGFNELLLIDPIFAQFEQLFNANSLHFQRNLQDEVICRKIKAKIADYLIFVTPYLLLRPSWKTVEWLVRRYQIHLWDKEALIACILPFHESKIFTQIIQLFGSEANNDQWDWLVKFQKEGSGFSTQSLINHCIENTNLLSFICKMADNAKEALKFNPKSGLKIVFSFHARMLAAVIEATSVISEELLSFLLPFIHSGLKSHVKDYACSTYMIISSISSKTKLMTDVTKAILAGILKSMEQTWYEEGLLCILSVIQLQSVSKLSQRIFKLFLNLKTKQCVDLLAKFEEGHDISTLIDLLLSSLCKSAITSNTEGEVEKKSMIVLKAYVDNLKLSEKQISVVCKNIIGGCTSDEFGNLADGKVITQQVKDFLTHLARRHTKIFDESICFYFSEFSAKEGKMQCLQRLKRITKTCLPSERHSTFTDSDLPLLLSLNHPESNIRIAAVQELFATLKSGVELTDEQFFKDAILARLNDDSTEVVHAVLNFPKSISKLFPGDILRDIVMQLMQNSDEHYNINELIAATIQSFPKDGTSSEINEFIYAVFGQLMFAFSGKKNKKLVESLDSIEFDSNNVILKGIGKALFHIPTRSLSKPDCTEEMVISAFTSLIGYIADTILDDDQGMDVVHDLWNYIQKLPMNHDLHFIGLMLLTTLIEKSPDMHVRILQLNFEKYLKYFVSLGKKDDLMTQLDSHETFNCKRTYLFTCYYSYLHSDAASYFDKVFAKSLFIFLNILIESFEKEKGKGDVISKQKLFSILSVHAINTSSQVPTFRNLLNQFFSTTFADKEEVMAFLCDMYIKLLELSEIDDESFQVGICSLHITRKLLSEKEKKLLTKNNIIYATHIALLQSPFQIIRKAALDNIHVLCAIASGTKVWSYLLHQAIECENNISMNPSYSKRCWELSFTIKDHKGLGVFMETGKSDKIMKEKKSSLSGLIKSIRTYPVLLQVSLLQSLELVDPKLTMHDYVPLLKQVLSKPSRSVQEVNVIQLLLKLLQPEMFDSLKELFPLFAECINHNDSGIQRSSFEVITPSFYNNINSTVKHLLLEELLKVLLSSNSLTVSTEVRIIIKSLELDAEHVCSLLQQFCDNFAQTYTPTVLSSTGDTQFNLDEDAVKIPMWRTLIEILEAISYKETTNHPELIVPAVFNILELCLKCSGIEYIKQLLLLTLLVITRQDLSKLSEDKFKVELLIQCLQSSNDTQTSHQCLMVLGNAARLYPTRVLHNIMHIFSFMGGTLLRLDNEYSFEIIENTINAVVPVLIQNDEGKQINKRRSSTTVDEIVTFILQTFVDSIPHCPEHRRLHIIKHLVKLLQESEHLHMVLILLLKKVVLQHRHKQVSEEENMQLSPVSLEFCKDLFSAYSLKMQIHSLYKMIVHVSSRMNKKEASQHKVLESTSQDLLFDLNDKQVNLFKYTLITFMLEMLKSETVMDGYLGKSSATQQHITALYLQLVEELLSYADKLTKSNDENPQSRAAVSLYQKVSEVITQLYDLLPFDSFITIVSKLLSKESELIRKRSLELLCKKLAALEEVPGDQENTLIVLCSTIMNQLKYREENDEGPVNKQLMLYAIKLIAMKLCKRRKEIFLKAIPVVAQLYTVQDSNQLLSINAMLCVAELCSLLKTDVFPYLPIIMKPLFVKTSIDVVGDYRTGDLMLSSGITILHTILKSLPQFLSPYVSDFLTNVASYDVTAEKLSDTALQQKITSLKVDMGKLFPPRVLFPAIKNCFASLLKTNKGMTISVIDVYRHSFKSISKADANSNYSRDILNITKEVFDVHTVLTSEEEEVGVRLEELVIEAFIDLVLKLTENTLRPMYLELLNWSSEKEDICRRLLSFFRLSVKLSNSLKSLFLLFVGHVLKNSKDVLMKINTINEEFPASVLAKEKFPKDLIVAVLDTLSNCFLYDSQGFINKERFESIMQPLVDQLENKVHGEDEYISFVKDHLSPCIINFAAAVNDLACWKPLNHRLLTKTKSEDEQVRFASLYIMEQMYTRMGESYMVLIPETIPFLAEILEDDSLEVEKQCQKVIRQIEDISGESIQKFF